MASAYFQMRRWSDICMDTDNPVRPVKLPGIWGFCAVLMAGAARSMPSKAINIRHSPARFCCSMELFAG